MGNQFYLDARYVDEHVSQLQDERRTAQRLRSAVIMTRDLGNPMLAPQYNRIIRSVDELVQYFGKMADTFEDLSYDAKKMQKRFKQLVEEGSEQVRVENDKIMI